MKKHLLLLLMFIAGIALGFMPVFSGNQTARYCIYESGPQNRINSYSQEATKPPPCPGDAVLCWIAVPETDANGVVSQSELDSFFGQHDSDDDGSLDDEEEKGDIIEKKS